MQSEETAAGPPPAVAAAALDERLGEAAEALAQGWYDEVLLVCQAVLTERPRCPEAVFLLGLTSFDLGDPVRGLGLVETAHELDPEVREYADALAALYAKLAKVNEALFYAKVSTTLAPHPRLDTLLPERFGGFFLNLMSSGPFVLRERAEGRLARGEVRKAASDCDQQLQLTPGDTATLRLLARACREIGETERAVAAHHAILHGEEAEAEDLSDLATSLAAAGRHEEARACHGRALALAPGSARLHSRLLHDLARRPSIAAAEAAAAHRDWRARHAEAVEPRPLPADLDRDPERPLRIGYLSGAFVQGDEMRLFEPVFMAHDRRRYQLFAYGDATRKDLVSEALTRATHRWTATTGIDDETLWEILRGDRIDVLVDLTGHGPGGRPLALARRPAPVVVNWLGACHPLGIGPAAHFLTDGVAWPENLAAPGTGDRLHRMEGAALAYRIPKVLPPAGDPPCLQAGHVTFGVSCDLAWIEPATALLWAGVLDGAAGARLLICNRRALDQAVIDRVLGLFANLGLRDRVDVVNPAENFALPAEFYGHVDIALDTSDPGQAAETALALAMGVPVLSRAGDRHATRLGASLLAAAGRPDWVAADGPALAALAADLAADPGALAALRAALPAALAASPLCDLAGFARRLEAAYRSLWRRTCQAEAA